MKVSTIVLSASAVLGLAGAFAAWHHLPCNCRSNETATVTNVAFEAPAPQQQAGAFKVDNVHSSVVYRIKHNNVAYFYGRFNEVSGEFLLDAADASKSIVNISVKTDSIDSNSDGRDKHLKSSDFFSATEFDSITFVAKSVKKTGDTTYEAIGDLTMLGKTKSVTTTIEYTGSGTSKRGGELSGIESTFTIKRSDFGMTYGVDGGALADEVRITVSLEGARS